MTVSTITSITNEGRPEKLSSFSRAGVTYVMWVVPVQIGFTRLAWKPHGAANFSEVISKFGTSISDFTVLYYQPTDELVVFWDDGSGADGFRNGNIFCASLNPTTGETISGPTQLFQGSSPKVTFGSTTSSPRWVLTYKTQKNNGVYIRLSEDAGVTWETAQALYNSKVVGSASIDAVPYSSKNITVAQLGKGSREMSELETFRRTRPLSSILKHPTIADRYFIAEPSKFDNTTLVDNQRGRLFTTLDGARLFHLDGVQQGVDDSIGALGLLSTSSAMSILSSAGPVGSVVGRNFVEYSLTPSLSGLSVTLPASTYPVDAAVSSVYAYVASYSDSSSTAGQLNIVALSDGTVTNVLSGLEGVRAVAVANFKSPALVFVATTESGVERLRVYSQGSPTPTLLANVKTVSRINALAVAQDPDTSGGVLVYASMANRLNMYRYMSSSTPVRLMDYAVLPAGGSFFNLRIASNGNIVAAGGSAGVVCLTRQGQILSQRTVSGKPVQVWSKTTSYSVGALVKPTDGNPFSRNQYYFRCSSAGTSGVSEPDWGLTGTMQDATAQWQPVGSLNGIVSDVEIDETAKVVYAVGSAGGALGTDGRVWKLSARGLV